jgi:hypothetical protein
MAHRLQGAYTTIEQCPTERLTLHKALFYKYKMVARDGIEPSTCGFSVRQRGRFGANKAKAGEEFSLRRPNRRARPSLFRTGILNSRLCTLETDPVQRVTQIATELFPSGSPTLFRRRDSSTPQHAVSQRTDVTWESTSPAPRPSASASQGPSPSSWQSLPVAIAATAVCVDAATSGVLGEPAFRHGTSRHPRSTRR